VTLRSVESRGSALALTASALVAAAFAGCGGGDSTPAPAAAPPGTYLGVTSQGLPISFGVGPGQVVTDVRFGWRARCADGLVHANTIALPGARIHYRVFSLGGMLETGGIAHIDGKFAGAEASGTLSRSRGSAFGVDCRATGIAWHAQMSASPSPGDGSA
jgi:hypothetical protein